MLDVSLILVNYHSGEPLRRFFTSLQRHPIIASYELIVVDNSPDDGVAEWLARDHPELTVLAMERNVGYARAVNAGIDAARGRTVLIVNPDIEMSEGGVDAALRYLHEHPEVGIVGARLLNPDGTVQRSARRFYTLLTILLRRTPLRRLFPRHPALRRHLMLDDDLTRPRPVDWVMGAWMLVRRGAIDRVGPMDGRFFLYFEDVDWCYRMWEDGYEVHYFPQATFVHEYQRSSGRMGKTLVHHLRSFLSFYDKWGALVYVAKRLRSGWEVAAAVLSDVLALNLAFLAAYFVRRLLDSRFPEPVFDLVDYLPLLAFTNVVSLVTLPLLGRYRRPAPTRFITRWVDAVRAALLVSLVVMAGTYLSHTRTFSRAVLLFFGPLYLLALELLRLIRSRVLAGGDVGSSAVTRVLLVGTVKGVQRLQDALAPRADVLAAGCIVTGPVDDVRLPRMLGRIEDLVDVVDRYRIEEVLVDGLHPPEDELLAGSWELAAQGVAVLVSHPWVGVIGPSEIGRRRHGLPWWWVRSPAACSHGAWVKLLADRPLGLFLSLLSLPGFVICYLLGRLLRLVDIRPVRRLGQNRRELNWSELVWRRSQRPLWGAVQLPLFLQVLAGHLSLVGPYPLPVGVEGELGPIQRLRFAVKPGLSGLWQHHLQESSSLRQLIHEDIDYLERWSLTLDLDLFLSALPQLIGGQDRWHRVSSSTP